MKVFILPSKSILGGITMCRSKEKRLRLLMSALFLFLLVFASSGLFSITLAQGENRGTIIIDEYEISIDGKISPGKHTLHVKNIGTMRHEVVIFKLKKGVNASDFKAIISEGGSLRKVGKMKGNMPPIETGATGKITATFDAGNYLLLCFQFDAKTEQPHFMIGMLHEFKVT